MSQTYRQEPPLPCDVAHARKVEYERIGSRVRRTCWFIDRRGEEDVIVDAWEEGEAHD